MTDTRTRPPRRYGLHESDHFPRLNLIAREDVPSLLKDAAVACPTSPDAALPSPESMKSPFSIRSDISEASRAAYYPLQSPTHHPPTRNASSGSGHAAETSTDSGHAQSVAPGAARHDKANSQPVPPTTNTMDALERKKRLKSAMKLSRVLGETPILSDEDEEGADGLRRVRSLTVVGKKLTRRRARADEGAGRPESLSLPRASARLAIPFQFPLSPSSAQARSPTRSPPVLRLDCTVAALPRLQRSASAAVRSVSTMSAVPDRSPVESVATPATARSPTRDTLEARRAKVAKLSRRLGEPVPPELVFPSNSAPPNGPDHGIPIVRNAGWKPHKRRNVLSLDITRRRTESTSSFKGELKRTVSAGSVSKVAERQEPLSEKQKAINVKRALKMTQMFGTSPPHFLLSTEQKSSMEKNADIQLTASEKEKLRYLSEQDRDSILDLLSCSTEPHPRTRATSTTSLAPSVAKSVTKSVAAKEPKAKKGKKVPQIAMHIEQHRRESTALSSPAAPPYRFELPPPATPPPFSSYFRPPSLPPPSVASTEYEKVKAPSRHRTAPARGSGAAAPGPDFRTRRERAAKLARFFGVGYHDLFNSMVHGHTVDGLVKEEALPLKGKPAHKRAETDVRMDGPGKEASAKTGDMREVIDKLREMKAGT